MAALARLPLSFSAQLHVGIAKRETQYATLETYGIAFHALAENFTV